TAQRGAGPPRASSTPCPRRTSERSPATSTVTPPRRRLPRTSSDQGPSAAFRGRTGPDSCPPATSYRHRSSRFRDESEHSLARGGNLDGRSVPFGSCDLSHISLTT